MALKTKSIPRPVHRMTLPTPPSSPSRIAAVVNINATCVVSGGANGQLGSRQVRAFCREDNQRERRR
jgi:hypothetical protein